MAAEQQRLYPDGWREQEPHMRLPGESDGEYAGRQFARLRGVLADCRRPGRPESDVDPVVSAAYHEREA